MWNYDGSVRPDFAETPGPGQESVWDYPRPPACVAERRRVRIEAGGCCLADSSRAMRVLETASAPTVYIPPDDVPGGLLQNATEGSVCEWKGVATYHDVRIGSDLVARAAWSYEHPTPAFAAIAGWLSFYPGQLACYLDDERVRAQAGGFYGGWVSDELTGPIKGAAGTHGW